MSVRVGSLLGIPVKLHHTLIVAVLLIAWTLASGYMPTEYPGLSSIEYWAIGMVGAITLFTSVLVHELAHSYVAKKNGLPVKRIVLFLFGGVSEIEEEPKSPGLELRVAMAGPASSFMIGAALGLAWRLLGELRFSPLIVAPLEYGSFINVMLGGFNLLPAFPLDGGRILRAALWKAKGDIIGATKIATRFGVAFSYLFMVGGVAGIISGSVTSGLWFMLIGWFLKSGAEASLRQTVIGEALSGITIRDIMTREVDAVGSDLLLIDLVNDYFSKYKHGGFPVTRDSTLLGLVTIQDLRKIPKERWNEVRVVDIMTPCEKLVCVKPDQLAMDALVKMSKLAVGRLPVQQDGKLLGIVTRSDVLRAIEIRSILGI